MMDRFNEALSTEEVIWRRMVESMITFGKTRSWPITRHYYMGIRLKGLSKQRNTTRVAGHQTDIRTGHLPNTN